MLRLSASTLLVQAPSVSLAVDARWEFAGLAALASLATLVLLALTLRSLRQDELVRASGPRHDRRRRGARGRPDARAALALVGDALAATHNPRALVPVILDVVTEATGARGARILSDGEELGWIGEPGDGRDELRLDLSAEDEPTRTELVLYPPPEGFSAEIRQLAEWLAAQAGIALENARLHDLVQRQAITDDLTGLVNRRRFLAVLESEVDRAAQLGSAIGVVLIDLDDFKAVNDRFGHHSGDRVLAAFGSMLRDHIRDVDLAARLGGEEFALLLPEVEGRDAVLVAERLRRSLSERPIASVEGNALSSTASFGVAQYRQGDTGEDLLRLADDALYRAKGEGKNRVCVAREGRAA
jgi:diguanylate cyclase (GGDEF)-like protein